MRGATPTAARLPRAFKRRTYKYSWEPGQEIEVVDKSIRTSRYRNRAYGWGLSATGALCDSLLLRPADDHIPVHRLVMKPRPLRYPLIANAQHVACGHGFTLLSIDKLSGANEGLRLFGCGLNTCMQLGYHEIRLGGSPEPEPLEWVQGPRAIQLVPEQDFNRKRRVTHLAAGRLHSIVATNMNEVFTLGSNSHGQCGRPVVHDEDYATSRLPHRVELDGEIRQVVCGLDHNLILMSSGKLLAFGCGTDGQLGNESCVSSFEPVEVKGDVVGENIVKVACSADTCLAVSDKGDVFAWGNSDYKQLGVLTDSTQLAVARRVPLSLSSKVIDVAASVSSCLVLTKDGKVFVWGYGFVGLGPDQTQVQQPTLLPEPLFSCNHITPDRKVAAIHASLHFFAAVTNKHELYTWGENQYGQLGQENLLDHYFPLKVPIPANVKRVYCGSEHMIAHCRVCTVSFVSLPVRLQSVHPCCCHTRRQMEDLNDNLTVPKELEEAYCFRLPRAYHYADYVWPGLLLSPERLQQMPDFRFRSNDILIASYPKSGTTWISEVVSLLVNGGDVEKCKQTPLHDRVPWLELDQGYMWVRFFWIYQVFWKIVSMASGMGNAEPADDESEASDDEADDAPRVWFTHLPLELMPKQALEGGVKIIYIARNPKDVSVSFFHFHRMARFLGQQKTTWEEFFPLYAMGKLYSGSWFEHVLSFWKLSQINPNVLFVKYEDMKKNLTSSVSQIADFLDISLPAARIERVVQHCTFDEMKTNRMVNREGIWLFNHRVSQFMRKGTVGDYQNYFTLAQNSLFNRIYNDRMKGTGLDFDFELDAHNATDL